MFHVLFFLIFFRQIRISNKYYYVGLELLDPENIIDYLLKKSNEPYLVHKIFKDMFPLLIHNNTTNSCKEGVVCLKYDRILNSSQYIFFIKRNTLDIFISEKKIHITQKYTFENTTSIKIEFNIDEYTNYRNSYLKWFEIAREFCDRENKKYVIIDYDELMKLDNEECQLKYCIEKLQPILDIQLTIYENNKTSITKQDLSTRYEDKISNYYEVKEFIENAGNHTNTVV